MPITPEPSYNFPNQPLLSLGKQCDYLGIFFHLLAFIFWFSSFLFDELLIQLLITFIAGSFYGLAYFFLRIGSYLYYTFKLNYAHFFYNPLGDTIMNFLYFGLAFGFVISVTQLAPLIHIPFFLLLAIFLFPIFLGNLFSLNQKFKDRIIRLKGGNPFNLGLSKDNILFYLRGERTETTNPSYFAKNLHFFDVLVLYYKDHRWLIKQLASEEYNRKFRYKLANLLYPNDKRMVLELIGI